MHSHAMAAEDEFYDYQPFQWQSPFDEGLHRIPDRPTHPSHNKEARRIINWPLVVAGLVELLQDGRREAYKTQDAISSVISERHPYWPHASKAVLAQHGLVMSMSRKGNCWDNAFMERFFLNLKMERVWRSYANHSEAMTDIADYIVGFYNTVRLPSKLGNQAPTAFERRQVKQPIAASGIS